MRHPLRLFLHSPPFRDQEAGGNTQFDVAIHDSSPDSTLTHHIDVRERSGCVRARLPIADFCEACYGRHIRLHTSHIVYFSYLGVRR